MARASSRTPQEFIRAWETSSSIQEVAEKLGLKDTSVSSRAHHYRKLGINLKSFDRGTKPLDVSELNSLIAAIHEESKPKEPEVAPEAPSEVQEPTPVVERILTRKRKKTVETASESTVS